MRVSEDLRLLVAVYACGGPCDTRKIARLTPLRWLFRIFRHKRVLRHYGGVTNVLAAAGMNDTFVTVARLLISARLWGWRELRREGVSVAVLNSQGRGYVEYGAFKKRIMRMCGFSLPFMLSNSDRQRRERDFEYAAVHGWGMPRPIPVLDCGCVDVCGCYFGPSSFGDE